MFKDKLRFLRKCRNLTQAEISQHLNIDQTTYSRYEIGATEPDIATIKKLAKGFNVSTDYLLENDNILDGEDVVDLNYFLLNGRYTIQSHFPSDSERRMLDSIIKSIFDEKYKNK